MRPAAKERGFHDSQRYHGGLPGAKRDVCCWSWTGLRLARFCMSERSDRRVGFVVSALDAIVDTGRNAENEHEQRRDQDDHDDQGNDGRPRPDEIDDEIHGPPPRKRDAFPAAIIRRAPARLVGETGARMLWIC
jgi:hypothetical protein